MKCQVGKSDDGRCVVRVGRITRSDPDSEVHIVRSTGDGDKDWERVTRVYVEGRKLIHFDLEPGEYHVMVIGDKIAGVMNTAGHTLEFPWNVFLDAPLDHSKDFLRTSIPTNVPVIGDLKRSIQAALKE